MNGESLPPSLPGSGQSPLGVPTGSRQNPGPAAVNKGMATTSLVLGILSMVCFSVLTGIPAIIVGHIAHGRARKSPQQYGGAGMAIAGFVMGYASLLVTLVILSAMLLPALTKSTYMAQSINRRNNGGEPEIGVFPGDTYMAQSINCRNNLAQIGLAFRQWALDNGDQFPFNVSAQKGGTLESCDRGADGFDRNAARHFQVMSNELNTPKILVCVADSSKTPAADFQNLQAANVSYLVRSGTNLADVFPNEILARCPVHGHILRCDGSVESGRKK